MKKYFLFVLLAVVFDQYLVTSTGYYYEFSIIRSDSLVKGIIGLVVFFSFLLYTVLKYISVFKKRKVLGVFDQIFIIVLYPIMEYYIIFTTMYSFTELGIPGYNYYFIPLYIIFYVLSPFTVCIPLLWYSRQNAIKRSADSL